MTKNELQQRTARVKAAMNTASAALDDKTALDSIAIFPMWKTASVYSANERVQYKGKLYKCVQAHPSQSDWTPDIAASLWLEICPDEYPEWKQPQGAHAAYNIGDKCSYNGKRYICVIDSNVYAPYIYGWEISD